MSLTATIIAFLAIFVLAIPFSMVGQGGGSTYVPILLATGMDFHTASTTSLFMIMIASLAATVAFGRKKTIDWKLLLAITPLGILGSFAGGYAAQFISVFVLKIIFAAVLIIAAFFMLRPTIEGKSPDFLPHWFECKRTCGNYQYVIYLGLLVPAVGLAGFIAGMIGVGGGLFVLPLLVLLFGCPTRIAIGVSSTYVGISALPGFIGNIWIALLLAVAAFIGASLGPMISLKTGIPKLRMILAVVLVALAIWMVVNILAK
ncbi:MAG: sulfite exporter TauE/SafE family protein [Dehalococcoidales bacterium]|nr:sulfite exporter TauE/SafE family protein [Dehalococcoidales bacterium]